MTTVALRNRTLGAATLALSLLFSACGDDPLSPEMEILEELSGVWTATSFLVAPVSDPTNSTDLIVLGGTLQMNVSTDGEIVTTVSDPGSTDQSVDVGTLTVLSATELQIQTSPTSPSVQYTFSLAGNRLELSGRAPIQLGTDPAVDSNITAVLVR
ncbi:MAG: hypothetical protein AAF389_02415 [Gemmatimonadota bacterium]